MKVTLVCLLVLAVCFVLEASASRTYDDKNSVKDSTSQSRRSKTSKSSDDKKSCKSSKSSKTSKRSRSSKPRSSDTAKLLKAIRVLEEQVDKVGRRGCATGNLRIVVCDPAKWDDTYCDYRYESAGFVDVPVAFAGYHAKFDETPVVTAGLSGIISDMGGKTCDVSAFNANKEGFDLRLFLGGPLPFYLNLFWMACDSRAH